MGKKEKRRYGDAVANAEMRSNGASYGYLKLPEGVRVFNPEIETVAAIDIMPYVITDKKHMDKIEVDTVWFKKPFKIHREVGVENDTVVCPTTFGKPCPICEHQQVLRDSDETDEEKLKKLNVKYRDLYVVKVLEYDGKKKFDSKAFHIFDFSTHLFQKIFENQLKRKKDYANFFIPESGKSLEITFDKKSFGEGKPFPIATRVDFLERDKQYDEDIVDKVPNLDEILTVLPYEELEAKFFGDDTSDSDEEPTKKDKKKKKSKDAEPEPEEEPKKGKKSKKEKEPEPEVEEPNKKDKKKKKEKVKELTGEEIIESAETLVDLLQVIETYPSTFADYAKKLKKIDKFKKLKKKMLAIAEETPFSTTDDLPF